MPNIIIARTLPTHTLSEPTEILSPLAPLTAIARLAGFGSDDGNTVLYQATVRRLVAAAQVMFDRDGFGAPTQPPV